jgi:hypothetical protein
LPFGHCKVTVLPGVWAVMVSNRSRLSRRSQTAATLRLVAGKHHSVLANDSSCPCGIASHRRARHTRFTARFPELFGDRRIIGMPGPSSFCSDRSEQNAQGSSAPRYLWEDSQRNVHAGEREVRPPRAPTTERRSELRSGARQSETAQGFHDDNPRQRHRWSEPGFSRGFKSGARNRHYRQRCTWLPHDPVYSIQDAA